MKITKIILSVFCASALFTACNKDIENIDVYSPYTYSPQYYQNLRDYKASDHCIAWGWFSDYTQRNSMATRFLGLPDSLDICSLWGGIPTTDSTLADGHYLPEVEQEMRFVQQTKGTKLVVPTIVRIRNFPDFYRFWGHTYAEGEELPDGTIAQEEINGTEYAMREFAGYLLAQIFYNNIDGIDLDYEPEGDPLSGSNFSYFVKFLGQFVGPKASAENKYTAKLMRTRWVEKTDDEGNKSLQKETYYDNYEIVGDPTKLLCIDYFGQTPAADTEEYTNWYVNQTYGGNPGGLPFGGCPTEKVVYTENVGDNWKAAECGKLLTYARYQPATGRKGGFGAFFMHRDYINSGYGFSNYANMRRGIQIQNPTIY